MRFSPVFFSFLFFLPASHLDTHQQKVFFFLFFFLLFVVSGMLFRRLVRGKVADDATSVPAGHRCFSNLSGTSTELFFLKIHSTSKEVVSPNMAR